MFCDIAKNYWFVIYMVLSFDIAGKRDWQLQFMSFVYLQTHI